jgi:hypothetical protein
MRTMVQVRFLASSMVRNRIESKLRQKLRHIGLFRSCTLCYILAINTFSEAMTKKLQVFVSSTYTDLKSERQAAVAAILKAGHIPAGMELFTAGDQSQLDTIKAWIDESDAYMLILGGRYGSIEATSGLSYTELEYNYAVAQNKPLFAVVISDDALEKKVRDHGMLCLERENPKLLEAFRAKVLSYISSFFDDEKDIKLAVHESVGDLVATKSLKGWVRGDTVVNNGPLVEELKKLSDENAALRLQVSEYRRNPTVSSRRQDFEDMRKILHATEIEIPATLTEAEPVKSTALRLFTAYQSAFSTGITNKNGMSADRKFLFFTVSPKLQIHGLVTYEKITGVQYQRCRLTQKGMDFLSDWEKEKVTKQEKKRQANVANNITIPQEAQAISTAKTTSKAASKSSKHKKSAKRPEA